MSALDNRTFAAWASEIINEPTGSGQDAFKVKYVEKKSRKHGATYIKVGDPILQEFAPFVDLSTLNAKGMSFTFIEGEYPELTCTERPRQLTLVTDVTLNRLGWVNYALRRAGVAQSVWNTPEVRKTIAGFPSTEQAVEWATATFVEEKKVTAPTTEQTDERTELDNHLERSEITRTQATRAAYFAQTGEIFTRFGIDNAYWSEYGHTALNVASHDDWKGTVPAALNAVLMFCMDLKPTHDETANEFKKLLVNNGAKLTDFKTATGYANRQDAYDNGKKPSDLYKTIQTWLMNRDVKDEDTSKSNEKAANLNEAKNATNGSKQPPIVEPANTPVTQEPIAEVIDKPANADTFAIDPFLSEAKTLMGIPAMQIQEFVNRKYEDWAYSSTKAPGGGKWTVIDPLAVRQRFDKIFGPHGIGWRIVPANESSAAILTPFTEATRNGDRDMYQLTLSGYVMEYRMRIGGAVEWQRTSAFTDSSDSDDAGYAGVGAFTSLMKQALKMLGGYDHFIIPEKKRKAA